MSKKNMLKELNIDWEAVADGLSEYRHIIQDVAILPNISKKEFIQANEVLNELIENLRDGNIEAVVSKKKLEQYLLEKEDMEISGYYDDEEDLPFR